MKELELTRMIELAAEMQPKMVTAALAGVRDRAALTLGEVTVQALLYSVALQVPPFSTATAVVNPGEPGALLAACANAPVAQTAELLTRFLDVIDRLTGGVMTEPLQEVAKAILATALEMPLPGALAEA